MKFLTDCEKSGSQNTGLRALPDSQRVTDGRSGYGGVPNFPAVPPTAQAAIGLCGHFCLTRHQERALYINTNIQCIIHSPKPVQRPNPANFTFFDLYGVLTQAVRGISMSSPLPAAGRLHKKAE